MLYILQRKDPDDERFIEDLICGNYEDIYKYCYRLLKNKTLAEDVTQEVFLKFISSMERYREYGKMKNYLYVIAGNAVRDYLKKASTLYETSVDIQEKYPGFAGFMKRFTPTFHMGLPVARMEERQFKFSEPTFDVYIVEEEPRRDIYRIFLIPDNKDFFERVEKLVRLRKTFEKYEDSSGDFSISFSAEKKVCAEAEKLVHELLTESTVYFTGNSVRTADVSEKNIAALDKLLMTAVKTLCPKNMGFENMDEAMVEVIRLCDSERMRIMLSDRQYFRDFFSASPYCWSSLLIMNVQASAQMEEILLPEEDTEYDDEEDETEEE